MSAQLPQCGEVSFALNCLLILHPICYAASPDLERPDRMKYNSSELLFTWIACIGPLLCMSAILDLKKDASDDQRVERTLVKWFTTDDTPVIKEYFFLYLCQLCTRNGKLKNDSSNRIGARFKTMYDVVSATPIDPFYLADLLRRMEKICETTKRSIKADGETAVQLRHICVCIDLYEQMGADNKTQDYLAKIARIDVCIIGCVA